MVELLTVIVIISILTALVTIGVTATLNSSKANSSELMLTAIAGALAQYQTRWGDYPPSTIDELGARAPNDTNNGVEALVACLSSKKRGAILYQPPSEELYANTDGDKAKNVTDWFFGDDALREVTDYFGNVITYFHHKDYARPKPGVTAYKFDPKGDVQKVTPEQSPATKTFVNPAKFQLRGVGRDGKPGTGDDVRAGN